MADKVAYLFAEKKRTFPNRSSYAFLYDGVVHLWIEADSAVRMRADLKARGYHLIEGPVPKEITYERGKFRELDDEDRRQLVRPQFERDHPGLSFEEGQLIDKLKAEGKQEGVLWAFEVPKIPRYMKEEPFEVYPLLYVVSGSDFEKEPFVSRMGLGQFGDVLAYFKEVLNIRNADIEQALKLKSWGETMNYDLHREEAFFRENPPFARPLHQPEVEQLRQKGIEVIVNQVRPSSR